MEKKVEMMLARWIGIVVVMLVTTNTSLAQSYAFGAKGGLTIGVQAWNGFERDPLFSYHAVGFIESAPEDNAFAIFAQAGYHVKGSALRNRLGVNLGTNQINRVPPQTFEFRTISLTLGGKQKIDFGIGKTYYLIGIRGDYTLNTNLSEYESLFNAFSVTIFPVDDFVQQFNYGATVGGGFEFPLNDLMSGLVEFTVNPDFSYQYRQPQINGAYDPFSGNNRTLPERLIRNVTLELTVGLRFLHRIIYVD